MADRDNFEAVLNPPKDDTMIATAQTEAALPFAVEWRHVADAGFAEPGK